MPRRMGELAGNRAGAEGGRGPGGRRVAFTGGGPGPPSSRAGWEAAAAAGIAGLTLAPDGLGEEGGQGGVGSRGMASEDRGERRRQVELDIAVKLSGFLGDGSPLMRREVALALGVLVLNPVHFQCFVLVACEMASVSHDHPTSVGPSTQQTPPHTSQGNPSSSAAAQEHLSRAPSPTVARGGVVGLAQRERAGGDLAGALGSGSPVARVGAAAGMEGTTMVKVRGGAGAGPASMVMPRGVGGGVAGYRPTQGPGVDSSCASVQARSSGVVDGAVPGQKQAAFGKPPLENEMSAESGGQGGGGAGPVGGEGPGCNGGKGGGEGAWGVEPLPLEQLVNALGSSARSYIQLWAVLKNTRDRDPFPAVGRTAGEVVSIVEDFVEVHASQVQPDDLSLPRPRTPPVSVRGGGSNGGRGSGAGRAGDCRQSPQRQTAGTVASQGSRRFIGLPMDAPLGNDTHR
ncbi:unnamed protein product [Discosporangium mesarthrocarpum]